MKVGIFGNQDSWYVRELSSTGARRGHQVESLLFEQLSCVIRHQRPSFRCGEVSLDDMDVVLVRTMPPGTLEQVVMRMDLLHGLQARGVRVVNSPRAIECAVDKYLTTQKLCLAGLPVPATQVCESAEAAMLAFEDFGRDVVIKPLFGAEGRGIMRVSDPELAFRAFRTIERLGAVIYIQEFLNGPRFDLRLLMLDGHLLGSMKRTPREGDFRANLSQQGTATIHTPSEHELWLAKQAALITETVFAGIDLMYTSGNEPVVIEVNAVPGWKGLQSTCGVDVPDRLFQWLETST